MTAAAEERTLPKSLDAERSVLGGILIDNDQFNVAAERLVPADFYRVAHRLVYEALIALNERGAALDTLTLREELIRVDRLNAVGGAAYIGSLADGVPHSLNVEHYARIVKEKATLRNLITAADGILTDAYEAADDAAVIVDKAEQAVFAVADSRAREGFVAMDAIGRANFAKMEALFQHQQLITGVSTGFVELDHYTRGFQDGDLIIIAARPSMGKTSLALNIAEHVSLAADGGLVGLCSLEMSSESLYLRLLSSVAHIDSHRLMTGTIAQSDFGRLSTAIEKLATMRLHIDDSSSLSVLEIRGKARRLKAKHGLSILIVDYIQLMTAPASKRGFENRTLELGALSRALKGLAKELDIPVVVLSQLSRAPEARKDHRPMLSDLRESGALEQDADVVLFIYRDEVYNPQTDDAGIAELIIAKQRNGPTGPVKLAFLREQTRFANLAQQ